MHVTLKNACWHAAKCTFPSLKSTHMSVSSFYTFAASKYISRLWFNRMLKKGCVKKMWTALNNLYRSAQFAIFFFFLFYFSSVYCGCSTYIFQRPLAVVFGEIVNWIGASALTPWDITILWHAADSFALPVSLLSSGGERRRVCLFALTPPVGFHCAVCLPEYPSLHS